MPKRIAASSPETGLQTVDAPDPERVAGHGALRRAARREHGPDAAI